MRGRNTCITAKSPSVGQVDKGSQTKRQPSRAAIRTQLFSEIYLSSSSLPCKHWIAEVLHTAICRTIWPSARPWTFPDAWQRRRELRLEAISKTIVTPECFYRESRKRCLDSRLRHAGMTMVTTIVFLRWPLVFRHGGKGGLVW
jgi:hypothetical protein